MTKISLASTTGSGFLEADFNSIKAALQSGTTDITTRYVGFNTTTPTAYLHLTPVVNTDNILIDLPAISSLPNAGYTHRPSITWQGGETKFGKWRQTFNGWECGWLLSYNTKWNYEDNSWSGRDSGNVASNVCAYMRFNVAEGDSGLDNFEVQFAPPGNAGTVPDFSDGGKYRFFAGSKTAHYPARFSINSTAYEDVISQHDLYHSGIVMNMRTEASSKKTYFEADVGSGVTQLVTFDFTNKRVGIGTTAPAALLSLGLTGTTSGVMNMAGSTSGLITIQPAAAAGTWTLTLPTSAGTNGYVLQTNGSGVTSWVASAASGDVIGPATNHDAYIPQWNGANSKLLKDGLVLQTTLTDSDSSVPSSGAIVDYAVAIPASSAQGDVLYHNGTSWTRLGYGTSGQFLKTQGVGANPIWASPSGAGDVLGPATNTDAYIPQWNGANSKTLKNGLGLHTTISSSDSYIPSSKAVIDYVSGSYAPIASPTFTGTVTLPDTVSVGDKIVHTGNTSTYVELETDKISLQVNSINRICIDGGALNETLLTGKFLLANNAISGHIDLDFPLANGRFTGITNLGTAGENLVLGDVVYFKFSDSKWWKADADAEATAGNVMIGVSTGTINTDATGTIFLKGYMFVTAWNWSAGVLYISNTPGSPTQTAPSGSGDIIRIIGYAITADIGYFCPDTSYVEHV